jgi:hypothetical protein
VSVPNDRKQLSAATAELASEAKIRTVLEEALNEYKTNKLQKTSGDDDLLFWGAV